MRFHRLFCLLAACPAAGTRLRGNKQVAFLHVPKAGGTSLEHFMTQLLPKDTLLRLPAVWPKNKQHYWPDTVYNTEVCKDDLFDPQNFNVVLLREPGNRSVSQFLQCRYIDVHFAFPIMPDRDAFPLWLSHFADKTWRPGARNLRDFDCFNPIDAQTRQLARSCLRSPRHLYPAAWPMSSSDLESAEQALTQFDFVGVQELYALSLCILTYKLTGSTASLPAWCGDPSASFEVSRKRHGLPNPSSITDFLSAADRENLRKITRLDSALYATARRLLLEDYSAFDLAFPGVLGRHLLKEKA
jgi:hypothetical protein